MTRVANNQETWRWIFTNRWLFIAPAMLFLWIIAQIDKTNVSLIIADNHFLNELHLVGHNAELGGLMSAFFLGYGFSIFGWGFLVDRFGPRVCAIAGSIAWAALLFSSSRVTTINEYLLVRFLLGVAEGNLWPVCNALTNYWYPMREHARVQTFWVSGSTLGTAVGVPVVSALMLASDWRGALAILSLVSLLPIAVFCFVGNRPGAGQRESAGAVDVASQTTLGELWRSNSFWLVTFCQFVSCTTIYTLIQWIPSYLTSVRHIPFTSMGTLITIGYVLGDSDDADRRLSCRSHYAARSHGRPGLLVVRRCCRSRSDAVAVGECHLAVHSDWRAGHNGRVERSLDASDDPLRRYRARYRRLYGNR